MLGGIKASLQSQNDNNAFSSQVRWAIQCGSEEALPPLPEQQPGEISGINLVEISLTNLE